ncbi:MAG: glycosyltransferase family 8 C-terminal domain-containing protein, partial [Escherichia coli]|nr:glycosyltransferase family 8 C-terminal domain-containing protein [Escherichia coli]
QHETGGDAIYCGLYGHHIKNGVTYSPINTDFNEAYQVSCWNDVAFIPATNEKQYQVKYQHAKKNGDTFNAFIYFIKFKLNKYKRKLFGQ